MANLDGAPDKHIQKICHTKLTKPTPLAAEIKGKNQIEKFRPTKNR